MRPALPAALALLLSTAGCGSSDLVAPVLQGPAAEIKRYFAEGLNYWPWFMLGYTTVGIMSVSLIGWWALSRLLARMGGLPDVHKLDVWDDGLGEQTAITPPCEPPCAIAASCAASTYCTGTFVAAAASRISRTSCS